MAPNLAPTAAGQRYAAVALASAAARFGAPGTDSRAYAFGKDGNAAHIFISHKSEDQVRATEVHDWLVSEGFQSFLSSHSEDGIAAGADWEAALCDKMRRTDSVVAVISKKAWTSHWVSIELRLARLCRVISAAWLGAVRRFGHSSELVPIVGPAQF